jgi:hypothetical protein
MPCYRWRNAAQRLAGVETHLKTEPVVISRNGWAGQKVNAVVNDIDPAQPVFTCFPSVVPELSTEVTVAAGVPQPDSVAFFKVRKCGSMGRS